MEDRQGSIQPDSGSGLSSCSWEAQTQVPYIVAVSSPPESTAGTGLVEVASTVVKLSRTKQEVETKIEVAASCQLPVASYVGLWLLYFSRRHCKHHGMRLHPSLGFPGANLRCSGQAMPVGKSSAGGGTEWLGSLIAPNRLLSGIGWRGSSSLTRSARTGPLRPI